MTVNTQTRAYIYAIAAVLLWSTVATAFKLTLRYLEVLPMLLIASTASTLFLFVILLLQHKLHLLGKLTGSDILRLGGFGLLNPVLYYLVLFHAYDLLPAQIAMAVNYTWAITLMLLSIPILGHRVTRFDIRATFICYSGVIIICFANYHSDPAAYSLSGILLAVASTVIWALYWLYKTRDRVDPVLGLFVSFLLGLPVLALLCWIFAGFDTVTATGVAGAVYIGLFEMGITFVLWLTALQLSTATARISTFIFISPFLSLVFIGWIVGERIAVSTIAGLVFIIAGIAYQKVNDRGEQDTVRAD